MAEYGNRYCLTLWLMAGTFLSVYGAPLFRLWYSPELGDKAAVLLPIMLLGQMFTMGQFVSGSILMGTGQFGRYSTSLMVEGIATVLGFFLFFRTSGWRAAPWCSARCYFWTAV